MPALVPRFFLFLCCCVLTPVMVQAQRDSLPAPARLEWGLGFGYMLHDMDFTPASNTEALAGSSAGLRLRYIDHHLMGFQAELSYQQSGWEEDFGEDYAGRYRREFDYVEALMLTQVSVGRRAFQPMVQAGPYLAVPIAQKEQLPAGFAPPDGTPPSYYGHSFDFRLNYGLQIGVGFNLTFAKLTVQADGRYLIGFNDLVKTGRTTAVTSRRLGYGGRVAVFYAW